MNKKRSIKVIKNGHPKKSNRSSVVIKNGRPNKSPYPSTVMKNGCPKKLACSLAVIKKWSSKEISLLFSSDKKNDHPNKLAHFQDQVMIPRMSKKTFKRQILRSCYKNTIIPEEESS